MIYMLKYLERKVLMSATCFEMHQKIRQVDGWVEYMDGYITDEVSAITC